MRHNIYIFILGTGCGVRVEDSMQQLETVIVGWDADLSVFGVGRPIRIVIRLFCPHTS